MNLIQLPAHLILGACIVAAGLAHAQAPASRIRGDIASVNGTSFKLKADSGETIVARLADKHSVSARARADTTKITPGVFLGTTAVPGPDGTLVATEVHIFPESMRGTGEGHRPMDAESGSTKTNATVASTLARPTAAGRTMTNATVASVADADEEPRMTLRYNGGEKVVTIPKDTPIVMVEPGDDSMLVSGAHVVVFGAKQSDGSLLVDRVQVGKNGFVPPI